MRLTSDKGDIFRTPVAEEAQGRVHVVWPERSGEAWNLCERVFDGRDWSARTDYSNERAEHLS